MDLKQRFTEEISSDGLNVFNLSFYVVDYLRQLPKDVQIGIIELLYKVDYDLFNTDITDCYLIGGVVKKNNPIFFDILLVIKENSKPMYVDIKKIDIEKYLDYIKQKQTLRNYDRTN